MCDVDFISKNKFVQKCLSWRKNGYLAPYFPML